MRGSRGRCGRPAALTAAVLEPPSVKPQRTNRLSRSFRLSQAGLAVAPTSLPAPALPSAPLPAPASASTLEETDPPRNERPEFKTPTRVPRSKPAAVFSQESPHNDCDLQHDIIWDATSPSPRRPGKRGKKISTGPVNISDIVSRIAPEHGRPQVSEPTLQQWIGDSATIPCTPDVQAPRAKKKSPRPNGVDDLLRLARQFDLNLFHQGEEHRQNPDLLTEDVPNLETESSSSLPGSCRTAVSPDSGPCPDRQLEDDLDFLFDGPTQHVSGALSQSMPAASCCAPTSHGPTSGSHDAFEDDWENDDLLNDSLVLEMTQNPQTFVVPRLCSTQKAPSQVGRRETSTPVVRPERVTPSTGSGVQKEILKPRATFRLESKPRKVWQEASRSAVETGPQTRKPEPLRSHTYAQNSQNPSTVDFLDDDLESFFSSEPVWDDPADDNLLCEMCEDLENQIWTGNHNNPPSSNQRTALQPTHRSSGNEVQVPAVHPGPAGQVGCVKSSQQPYRFTRPEPVSGGGLGSSTSRLQQTDAKHFSFKKPSSLVSTATSEAASGKCSAAEIELKKQRAMERRRQRLQVSQSLRAQT